MITFKNKTSTQVFSCKICEIFENIYFEEHLQITTSEYDMRGFSWIQAHNSISQNYFCKKNMCNFVNFSIKPEKDEGNIFHLIGDISKYFFNIFVNKTRS